MLNTIYLEEHLQEHPRVQAIKKRFPDAKVVLCQRYGEVFNPRAQHFRLQKQQPALILAEKFKNFVLPTPQGYGIGGENNFYFSHMLNCLYDCRYCFLQGMYQSANYVVFVNYEDFQREIQAISTASPETEHHFFSGYDCDSLAFEPVTQFAEEFLPFFAKLPNACLELRTKSTQIRSLLKYAPWPRCVVAFSLSPDEIAKKVEAKAPPLARRLAAIEQLQDKGWQIGLRFDPLIYQTDYQGQYKRFFEHVFARVNLQQLHSVSLGLFRLPEGYFKRIQQLYPDERLFASPLEKKDGTISYYEGIETSLQAYCTEQVLRYIPKTKFWPCCAPL